MERGRFAAAFRAHSRFTLVELMMVVGIVAVLAAIAIPAVHDMQLRAKIAEAEPIMWGIRDAGLAYTHAYDVIYDATMPYSPTTNPGKSLRDWDHATPLADLPFAPDGQVRCGYQYSGPGFGPPGTFAVNARCDVDGDDLNCVHWMQDVMTSQAWIAKLGDTPCY